MFFIKYDDIYCVYAPNLDKKFHFLKNIEDKKEIQLYLENKYKSVENNLFFEDKIKTIYLLVTENCNFECKYCFQNGDDYSKNLGHISVKNINKVINYLKTLNLSNNTKIFLYGGEPFMYPEIVKEIILHFKKDEQFKDSGLTICTNGSFYSEEIACLLKKHNVYLSISLDGNKTNNSLRVFKTGKETYDTIMRNIKLFQNHNIEMTISCTINEKNIDFLPEIPLDIYEQTGIKSIGYNYPIGNFEFDIDFLSYQLFKSYEVAKSIGVREDFISRRMIPFVKGEPFYSECNAVGQQIVFYPDLSISNCMAHKTGVNFDKYEVMKNQLKIWKYLIPNHLKDCSECVFKQMCGGGCVVNRKYFKGLSLVDKTHCRFVENFVTYFLKKQLTKDPKVVVLDYDGTIIERNIYNALLASAKIIDKDNFLDVMNYYEEEIKGFFSVEDLLNKAGKKFITSSSNIKNAKDKYFDLFEKSHVSQDTIEVIKYLKKKYRRLIVFSARTEKYLINELKEHNIIHYFDKVYAVKPEDKNNISAYKKLLMEENIKGYESIYIGDCFEEIAFAEKLGMNGILVKRGIKQARKWLQQII